MAKCLIFSAWLGDRTCSFAETFASGASELRLYLLDDSAGKRYDIVKGLCGGFLTAIFGFRGESKGLCFRLLI